MPQISDNMTIEETLRIALEAHEGQKDLDGRPAVLHPIAVGLMGSNDTETKTGFLHDVVEDSDLTMDELRGRGVDEDAIHVKMNDLRHNLERGLRTYAQAVEDGDTEKAECLARINDKHRKALQILEGCGLL